MSHQSVGKRRDVRGLVPRFRVVGRRVPLIGNTPLEVIEERAASGASLCQKGSTLLSDLQLNHAHAFAVSASAGVETFSPPPSYHDELSARRLSSTCT